MQVWLAMDTYPAPELGEEYRNRVSMQDRAFVETDFPPGPRSRFYDTRIAEVDEATWKRLLAGELTPGEQDEFHRDAWNQTATSNEELWSRP